MTPIPGVGEGSLREGLCGRGTLASGVGGAQHDCRAPQRPVDLGAARSRIRENTSVRLTSLGFASVTVGPRPPTICVQVQSPGTYECDLVWK